MEGVVQALDAPLESLANSDARAVSKQLGDVAEEAAYGAVLAQEAEARERGLERLDTAIGVLAQGASKLVQLGVLGADLGEVAQGDLARVVRSRKTEDLFHAELAALHMAQRLHRPNPSFGANSGGGGSGLESGSGHKGDGESGEGEGDGEGDGDGESEFDRIAEELARLAQEHGGATERTSSALRSAEDTISKSEIEEEARRRAAALRTAAARLPQPGERSESGRAAAALAREHVGAMAHELERLAFREALESGRRARAAVAEAKRRGLDAETSRQIGETQRELVEQQKWARERLNELNQQMELAAREALSEVAKVELELAERARRLSREDSGEAALPDEIRDRLSRAQGLMKDAARRLQSGRGQIALRLQQEAQRLLEESETGRTDESEGASSEAGNKHSGTGGDVPGAEKENRAEEFRRRVLDGLSKRNSGRLSPAVKRYAEGLLR